MIPNSAATPLSSAQTGVTDPAGPTTIGKIVKSNTHIDYVCQVYCRGEVARQPQPLDYALGGFVAIDLEDSAAGIVRLIGVIYNTYLLNPDFGSLGPRLSQSAELEVFSPDYLAETATLVGIIAVGWQTADGRFRQGVPELAATINTTVSRLSDDELLEFHTARRAPANGQPSSNGNGAHAPQVCLHYVPVLLATKSPIVPPLLLNIVDRLALLFPAQQRGLAVMRNNLAWKSMVEPIG